MNNTITITAPDQLTSATFVPDKGGVASSITMPFQGKARELLFLHDNFWDDGSYDDLIGGWPFLFPVCARLADDGRRGVYRYGGEEYQLPIHGFAPYMSWEVEQLSEQKLQLTLRHTHETLQQYPFQFEVMLTYEVFPGELHVQVSVRNFGENPMPYYAGFHPYFLMPPNKADVTLDYRPTRCLEYNKDMTAIVGEQPLFDLPSALDNPELNEKLTMVGADKSAQLTFADGFGLSMMVTGKDPDLFSYIQLYNRPEKPYYCVEPWMNAPGALNDLEKVRFLEVGAQDAAELVLKLEG